MLNVRQKQGPQGSRVLEYSLQDRQVWSEYMLAMMREGDIPFILPWHLEESESSQTLAFDMTGEISLFEYMKLEMSVREILRIAEAILRIWEEKDEYFLEESGFVMDNRYWFWDESKEKIKTLYLPISGDGKQDGLISFMRSIARTLAIHSLYYRWSNELVICMIHRFYNICADPECELNQIKDWVRREDYEISKGLDHKSEPSQPEILPIILEENAKAMDLAVAREQELEQLFLHEEREEGLWSRIKSKWFPFVKGN